MAFLRPPLAAAIALLAIAPGARAGGPSLRHRTAFVGEPSDAIARAAFEPPAFDAVFDRAVRALRNEGYEILECDADRGKLVTRPLELDASCGKTTCLARQSYAVLLGYRAARVTLSREVFDGATRQWVPAAVPEMMPSAQVLVLDMVAANPGEARRARAASSQGDDPCHEAREVGRVHPETPGRDGPERSPPRPTAGEQVG
jgi:hypothetical protein